MQIIFLVWHKKFGPEQNILGPVKGQSSKEPKGTNLIILDGTRVFYRSYMYIEQTGFPSQLNFLFGKLSSTLVGSSLLFNNY